MSLFRLKPLHIAFLLLGLLAASAWAAMPPASRSATAATTAAATRPTTGATTAAATQQSGPDVVVLKDLVSLYEPVPFAHRHHAQMAEMWDGCTTCHHHTPDAATTRPTLPAPEHPSQDDAAAIPACKSCHALDDAPGIHMPSLKAAYHRQCLNCHRDWMDANACGACHAVRPKGAASAPATRPPSTDDIVGRMHKPIPAPTTREFVTRVTPADGPRVLFRHQEHVQDFGIKCVACHRNDSCSTCHSAQSTTAATTPAAPPVKASRTWRESHGPCLSCHQTDRCSHCHYEPGKAPPPPFRHESTGQSLDKDHAKLACGDCHAQFKTAPAPSCGGTTCHKRPVTFPSARPGLYKAPATTQAATAPAATEPATRPTIIRIRRGGL